jgi:hypothetical protein
MASDPAPSQHGKQIGIGHAELLAHQVGAFGQDAVQVVEALEEPFAEMRLGGFGQGRLEQGRRSCVDLAG